MGVTPYVFDYAVWTAMFPELANVSSVAATGYFNLATLYIRNDGSGPICDPNMQAALLNFTTAHLAKLFSIQTNGQPNSSGAESPSTTIVGRINNASEGSVSVATEMPEQPPSAAWWNQTQYGATVWTLLRPFRTMRYLTRPRRVYNPPARLWGWGI